jgi:rhamnogalacturonan endolyase
MLIVVANSSGGIGKSTFPAHLAAWLHELGHRVTLAGCDARQSSFGLDAHLLAGPRGLFASTFLALALVWSSGAAALGAADALPKVAKTSVGAPVTVTDNGGAWILDNGIIRATINKNNSNMPSLIYHGINTMGPGGFWEQTPSGAVTQSLTIDPAKNGGERAEVAIKGVNGRMDIEVRYMLERGLSGIYTYAQFSHEAGYPAAGEGESRFILQLDNTFDWISVDADRNMLMPSAQDVRSGVVIHAKEQKILLDGIYKNSVDHKYSYCAVMYKLPAYGWSSTKNHIGVYFINPTTEYIGGGAEKLDLVAHTMATLLDYWTSGHYAGGAGNNIPAGENWKKVIGPIFVYYNALADPKDASKADLDALAATAGNPTVPAVWRDNAIALWQDALARAKSERASWPYNWVGGVDYPHKEARGNVTGQLVLDDPQAAAKQLPHLRVGLAHPDYQGNGSAFQLRAGNGATVTWPHDGNYYQFWTDGAEDGEFTIANVRPGEYTLHAFADGVLGEYAKTNIIVEAGRNLKLGKLDWQPVRYGKQIWEIGYPDRTAGKFYKGDGANYWLWGWCLRYGDLFPNDITYTIGKSDYHKDWFFEETPHALSDDWKNPAAKDPLNQRFGWVNNPTGSQDMWRDWGRGRATTWTIKFNMKKTAQGQAVLRVALAGADGNGGLAIGVNGQPVGGIRPVATNALRYNTDTGVWYQYTQKFDAALLKEGENSMTLTVPAGDLTTGVVWDYLRLELNDGSTAFPAPAQ